MIASSFQSQTEGSRRCVASLYFGLGAPPVLESLDSSATGWRKQYPAPDHLNTSSPNGCVRLPVQGSSEGQHNYERKLLCWATSVLFHKGSVSRGRGVKRAHLLSRGGTRKTGINRSLNRGHTPPLSGPENWPSSRWEQSNGPRLAS
jgi:hypothetical protein